MMEAKGEEKRGGKKAIRIRVHPSLKRTFALKGKRTIWGKATWKMNGGEKKTC